MTQPRFDALLFDAGGVVVMPGRPWYPAEPEGPHLRLTYAGSPEVLDEGVRRLAAALS